MSPALNWQRLSSPPLPAEDWGDQRCLTALPYVCKRSNTTRKTQSLDLPPAVLGGCPSGWSQFLNKVGGSMRGNPGEGVNRSRPSLRGPGLLATSTS